MKNRRKTDINFRLAGLLRSRVRAVIKGKSKFQKTLDLIGCSIEELKQHLQSQFQPGMTWKNHGFYGWHIDHKRPCASFDLTDPKQQLKCFNYKNLQPLWAEDNLKKSDKLNYVSEIKQ